MAAKILPRFGSDANNAVLTRGECEIFLAISLQSFLVLPLTTSI
jgi:hypothetical protein